MPDTHFQNYDNRHNSAPEEHHILKSVPTEEISDLLLLATQVSSSPAAAFVVVENRDYWIKAALGISESEVLAYKEQWQEIEQKEESPFSGKVDHKIRENGISRTFSWLHAITLKTKSGEDLGVLIVFDRHEKKLSEQQYSALKIVAAQLNNLVAFRRQTNEFRRVQHNLEQRYKDLEKFASVVSHDIKSPLANIISLTELLKEENKDNFDDETAQYIDFLSQASYSLRNYVDGLLIFYRSDRILEKEEEDVELEPFFESITKLYAVKPDVEINYPHEGRLEKVNKAALTQIFFNLISNALKYNNKEHRRVDISFEPARDYYLFEVKDNGNGIPAESFKKIFELFTTLDQNDRDGNPGSGIGLATVQKLLHHMGGDIQIESEPGKGSTFKIQIKRW